MRRGSCQATRGWLSVTIALAACHRSPTEPPTAAETRTLADAACPRVTRALFFKVEREGRVSHLLGTRHLGVALARFPPAVMQAFRTSRVAVFESVEPEPTLKVNLAVELGDARWQRFRTVVGGELAERAQSAQEAIATIVTLWEDRAVSLDGELQQLATQRGMVQVGLDEQAEPALAPDPARDDRRLRELLDSNLTRDGLKATTEAGLRSYCTTGSSKQGAAPELDQLDAERNRAWMPLLDHRLARGGAFVAVGSNHLVGPDALPALLRARGYTVTDLGAASE